MALLILYVRLALTHLHAIEGIGERYAVPASISRAHARALGVPIPSFPPSFRLSLLPILPFHCPNIETSYFIYNPRRTS